MRTCLAILIAAATALPWPAAAAREKPIESCFTPGMDCTGKIVDAIDGARAEVLVQAYAFTSCPIVQAIAGAHGRGVPVRVLLDKFAANAGAVAYLRIAGLEPRIDAPVADTHPGFKPDGTPKAPRQGLAHIKAVMIDGRLLLTGSFNFSRNAQERNVENLLIVRRRVTVREHVWRFESRWRMSQPAAAAGTALACAGP
jgi:phosphatidylserine/phosphatidylglycerophosphate/cardiolipin synthase-like enzyme